MPVATTLGEAPRPCPARVEPTDELPVHKNRVALGDALQRSLADRGVPRRDREREEALAGLRNGEPELGEPRYRQGVMNGRAKRICRDGAASTTTLTVTNVG
jgi:hypothetical protein